MGTIVLTGGGTGGHIIPNLALLPQLGRYFSRIVYIAGDGMEARLVPAAGIPFYRTETVKLDRSHLLENFKIPFVMRRAIEEAKSILDTEKPDIVFSKGGYAALPTCYAAKAHKIPVVVHESDYSLGLANRLCTRFAAAVLTSFPETGGGILTGNPYPQALRHSAEARRTDFRRKPRCRSDQPRGRRSAAASDPQIFCHSHCREIGGRKRRRVRLCQTFLFGRNAAPVRRGGLCRMQGRRQQPCRSNGAREADVMRPASQRREPRRSGAQCRKLPQARLDPGFTPAATKP